MRGTSRRRWRTSLVVAALAAAGAWESAASAQLILEGEDRLAFERPESWAMTWVASLTLLTPLAPVPEPRPWEVELGIEAGWVPSLSEEERTVGFFGTKPEAMDRTEALLRPRLTVGLPGRLAATVGWVPPVELEGVTPHLLSLALARPIHRGPRWQLGLRLHGEMGKVEGDITCNRATVAAGDDLERNPFQCLEPSDDTLRVRYGGLDATAAVSLPRRTTVVPYLTVGVNRFDLETEVDARYADIVDRTRLTTEGTTWNTALGLRWQPSGRLGLTGELFYTPLDVVRRLGAPQRTEELVNFRAAVSYRLR